jgi:hypothetical protein
VFTARRAEVAQAAGGSRLVVRVLADLFCEQPEASIGAGQLDLGDAYEEMLDQERILGPAHPATLGTRGWIDDLTSC